MFFVEYVQKIFNLFGFQLSRRARGVQLDSALEEQLRLAGKDIKTIIEIGAADGRDTAIYAARCPKANIYAFEPLPASFAKLQKNNINSQIKNINAAISNEAGKAKFHVTALADASSLLSPSKTNSALDKYINEVDVIEVNTLTLDEYCMSNDISAINILKIDAQGAELKILEGSTRLLSEGRIKVIYSEVNFIDIYENCSLYHTVAQHLQTYGYRIHNFYDLVYSKDGQVSWGDAIFIRDS